MGEGEGPGAARLLPSSFDLGHLGGEVSGGGVGEEAVGEAAGAAQRFPGAAAHPDGDRPGGGGAHGDAVDPIDRAIVRDGLTGPGPGEEGEDLLHGPSPTRQVGTEGGQLGGRPSQAQAQHEAAPADEIHGGGILGEAQRMVQGGRGSPRCRGGCGG
ncbi:MAG: hypothetical protein ABIJ48_10145 [Actinomycetota bacterium]